MRYEDYCQAFAEEGARLVRRAEGADLDAQVPGCPEWRVADLLSHVGYVHRWVRHLVTVRASRRISGRDMELSRGPLSPDWLGEGVSDLLDTLRQSDPEDPMWAWGADQHVRFWARRMLPETLVHRLDLEAAIKVASAVEPARALDAIDEFLVNLTPAASFSPTVAELVGDNEVLAFVAEEGPTWLVRLTPTRFEILEESRRIDAALSGPALELVLTLYRRRTLEETSCVIEGRADLVQRWWSNSALP